MPSERKLIVANIAYIVANMIELRQVADGALVINSKVLNSLG